MEVITILPWHFPVTLAARYCSLVPPQATSVSSDTQVGLQYAFARAVGYKLNFSYVERVYLFLCLLAIHEENHLIIQGFS